MTLPLHGYQTDGFLKPFRCLRHLLTLLPFSL
jgi:hypothetical protein